MREPLGLKIIDHICSKKGWSVSCVRTCIGAGAAEDQAEDAAFAEETGGQSGQGTTYVCVVGSGIGRV